MEKKEWKQGTVTYELLPVPKEESKFACTRCALDNKTKLCNEAPLCFDLDKGLVSNWQIKKVEEMIEIPLEMAEECFELLYEYGDVINGDKCMPTDALEMMTKSGQIKYFAKSWLKKIREKKK